jgi:hypothetical protein
MKNDFNTYEEATRIVFANPLKKDGVINTIDHVVKMVEQGILFGYQIGHDTAIEIIVNKIRVAAKEVAEDAKRANKN